MDDLQNKKALRSKARRLRAMAAADENQKKAMDLQLLDVFIKAYGDFAPEGRFLFGYAAYGSEASVSGILKWWRSKGGKTALPKVTDVRQGQMQFFEVTDSTSMEAHSMGMLEPKDDDLPVIPDRNTWILVPGLLFTKHGKRLGQGGGFYDRYLTEHEYGRTIGVGYDCQIVSELWMEPWDQLMDEIMTPSGFVKINETCGRIEDDCVCKGNP